MDLYTFLKRLPKVSLHVHLAGTVQPFTLVELARKNGVPLPAYREPADLCDYPDIYQFRTMLDRVMASVRDRDDFHRITYDTLQQAAEHKEGPEDHGRLRRPADVQDRPHQRLCGSGRAHGVRARGRTGVRAERHRRILARRPHQAPLAAGVVAGDRRAHRPAHLT